MKRKFFAALAFFISLSSHAFGQVPDFSKRLLEDSDWKVFSEIDLGVLATTGGYATYLGLRTGPHSFELGYEHFPSPSAFFSGTPEGFDMTVDYIYSLSYGYFWNGKTDEGFFTRFMYHNKMQMVTEKSSGISKNLYSDLVGVELGYVWYFYKGFYVTPRIGTLYYIKSPQGKENKAVQVGSSFYDNKRHKILDTYLIPTISVGYSLPIK